MTTEELHKILDNEDTKLSIKELQQVIYELKQDCFKEDMLVMDDYSKGQVARETYISKSRYYMGEQNAFRIALDLLDHLDSDKTEV